jgi:CBS domain containing-hemolysin-like protein
VIIVRLSNKKYAGAGTRPLCIFAAWLELNHIYFMISDIIITLLLVLLNGFFVAAEFAIVKVRASQIQLLAQESMSARIANNVVSHLDGYLAATQLGITLASLGLGWIGEPVVGKMVMGTMALFGYHPDPELAHKISLPIAFAVITVLHIVFGELAPKTLAIRFPTSTTLWVSAPLRVFYFVFKPFIWLLNGLANVLLRVIGVQPVPHSEIHSEEELKMIISESAEGGAIRASERELIQNVFDFDDRLVKQIITPRPQIIGMEKSMLVREAVDMMIKEGFSRFPVYEDSLDNVVGYVHTKDVLLAAQQTGNGTIAPLVRNMPFVHSNKKVIQLLRQFQKEHVQIAAVTNEFGSVVGIVTLEDIMEELVGDIQDEHDTELPTVEKVGEKRWKVLAQSPIDEINESLPFHFPEDEDYETLAGLIQKTIDGIPEEGQVIQVGHYEVKIVRMFRTSPELVEITQVLGSAV